LRNALLVSAEPGSSSRQAWVTAILCVGTDPPAAQPTKQAYVWVVGMNDLVSLLRRGNL
jgi:hypothetical protein